MLKSGLYEQVISKSLRNELDLNTSKLKSTALIDIEEASKILSKYMSDVIEKELDNIKDKGGNLQDQVSLVNKLVTTLVFETGQNYIDDFSVDKILSSF